MEIRNRVLILISAICLFLTIGYISQPILFKIYRPNGTWLTSADGGKSRYILSGTEHSGPVFVLCHGIQGDADQLFALQTELSKFATVISYDRLGMGWSPGVQNSGYDAASQSIRMKEILSTVVPNRLLILVGYSFGAIHERVARDLLGSSVVGMIMIDPSHEKMIDNMPQEVIDERHMFFESLKRNSWLARFGLLHLKNLITINSLTTKSVGEESQWHNAGTLAEMEVQERSLKQAEESKSFGQLPVLIFSARAGNSVGRREFNLLHDSLLLRGSHTKLFVVPDADHLTITAPQYAPRLAKEINRFLGDTHLSESFKGGFEKH